MNSNNDDGSFLGTLAAKIRNGRELVTADDLSHLEQVLSRDKAKLAAGQQPSIPYLDRASLMKNNGEAPTTTSFVRYVGMVQDMMDMEYYVSEIKGVKTHYRDYYYHAAAADSDSNAAAADEELEFAQNLAERQPLLLVPIPFASKWTYQTLVGQITDTEVSNNNVSAFQASSTSNNKREREQTDDAVMDSPQQHSASTKTPRTKDKSPETDREDDSGSDDSPAPVDPPVEDHSRALSLEWWRAGTLGSDTTQCPVLAKMYYDLLSDDESSMASRLRLNDVVEVVGLVSLDPMDADFAHQNSNADSDLSYHEDSFLNRTVLPPPSLLPRLHVLSHKTLNLDEEVSVKDTIDTSDKRQDIIELVAKQVFGDTSNDSSLAAAEALLLVLLSMGERERLAQDSAWTPVKTPNDTTLGCASLNFVLPDKAACAVLQQRLMDFLKAIVPVAVSFELDRETIGKTVVSPTKTESGRMVESPLQLPQGAALVINQATLTAGPVSPVEAETLQALASLTKSHSVPYRFDGNMRYNFEADYRVVVLSTSDERTGRSVGSKLLPCTLCMPLSNTLEDSMQSELPEEANMQLRRYLARCRSSRKSDGSTNVAFSKELLERAQEDFIERRSHQRANNASGDTEIGEEDFHRWLTMTRLQARSRIGDGTIVENIAGAECWNDALQLDDRM